jgi:hypothetical protein
MPRKHSLARELCARVAVPKRGAGARDVTSTTVMVEDTYWNRPALQATAHPGV